MEEIFTLHNLGTVAIIVIGVALLPVAIGVVVAVFYGFIMVLVFLWMPFHELGGWVRERCKKICPECESKGSHHYRCSWGRSPDDPDYGRKPRKSYEESFEESLQELRTEIEAAQRKDPKAKLFE